MLGNIEPSGYALGKENLMPREEKLEVAKQKKRLRIAVAKESATDENRVALAPHAVELLINYGHEVWVEKGAGETAHFDDLMYAEAGGKVTVDKKEIYQSDIIVKVAPPNSNELTLMKERQILVSSFQPGTQSKQYIEQLINLKTTAVGFEFLKDRRDDVFPIVQSLSEISGTTSILIAAEYLSNSHNGKGEMLGGISGISPTDVVILGAGTAGEFAARTALGLGATVKVFDISMHHLRDLQERLGTRIFTSVLQPRVLAKAMRSADVVIGAIPPEKEQQPFVVSEDTVKQMKPRSVIVDLRMDHGGCFETSELTSFQNPVYTKHGVVHFCVPNIPSRVARTASYALSNILGQIIIEMGDAGGINQLVKEHPGIRAGVYVYNGILTKESIGSRFNLPFQDIHLIMAAF